MHRIVHLWQLGWDLTKRDLAQHYRGTVLGVLWPFLYSGMLMILYTFVFSVILKVRWSARADALPSHGALSIFAGLVPYLFVAEVLTRAPVCISSVPNFVKKVRFPLIILPCVVVGSAAVLSLINTAFLITAVLVLWGHISANALFLPLVYVPLLLLLAGCAWFMGALGVFFRDLTQITPLFAQVLMFLAPVCYPLSQVPSSFMRVIGLNPLTYFVTVFRDLILEGNTLDWSRWVWQVGIWGSFAVLGFLFFRRTRRLFADLL